MSKSPRLLVAVLTLSVALALVLGVSSGATAGALTRGVVKKLAAKVVAKKAPGLSVSHAATATSADALAGKPPSAYVDATIRYPLVTATLSSSKSFALVGLTPGATYYIHYHLLMGSSPGIPAGNCVITVPGSAAQPGWGYGTVFSNAVSFDNGAVVTVPNTGNVSIVCSLGANASTFTTQPSFAEATPLDSVTSRAATATPGRPAGSPSKSATPPRP
jgi:hypothetical protein